MYKEMYHSRGLLKETIVSETNNTFVAKEFLRLPYKIYLYSRIYPIQDPSVRKMFYDGY